MRTHVQDTSIKAFMEIKHRIGEKQQQLLNVFYENPAKDFSDKELAEKYLHWPINTVTPRRNELAKKGILKKSRKKQCRYTGRTVWAWKIA